jgi:hypothetical protein
MDNEKRHYRELYSKVSRALWEDWDPIGVNYNPQASDEYESYVPQVVRAILQATSHVEIVDMLVSFETDNMGLSGISPKTESVAKTLFSWKPN